MNNYCVPFVGGIIESIFNVEFLDEVEETYSGETSALVRCIATETGEV